MKKVWCIYDKVPLSERTPDEINGALPAKWVKAWKTADTVRARVVVMGCFQEQIDPDVVYASTPTLVTMRILLLMALARDWTIKLLDVSIAFLHAAMLGTVLIVPPKEFYPNQDCLWELKRLCMDWNNHLPCGNHTFKKLRLNWVWNDARLMPICIVMKVGHCMSCAT